MIPYSFTESFTIFREIFEDFWRPSKVSSMVRIYTTLAIARVLLIGAPTGLILKHIEGEHLNIFIKIIEII